MAHGLKYELLCTSRLSNLYKLKLSFDGYAGDDIDRDIPLPSFFLSKDKAGVIKGTSLQFSIREIVDFEFLEFYTNNAKYIKAELYKSTTLLWSGYVAPQQYQVSYKPAPCNVTFLATDGLGLLKSEEFTLTGSQSQLAIIMHCLDKIALNLGYSIALDLFEANHNETYSPLAQTYEDASNYKDKNCYEVLALMLGKYNAEISQCGGRWRIVGDNDKKSTPKLYTYLGVYESAGSAPSVLDLGYPGTGIEVSPVGILQMGLQAGGKSVKIMHSFGRKDSWLDNYDFTKYESSMFTGWSKNGSYDVLQREHEGKKYAFLKGYSNTGVDYIHQSHSVVNTDGDDFVFEIDVCPVGFLSHGYSSKSPVSMTVKMLIRLYDGVSTYYYLGTEGWETTETYLEISFSSSVRWPVWQKVSVTTSGLPCSGTLLIRLYRFQAASEPSNTTYSGIAYSMVKAFSLDDSQILPGILETTASFNNSTEPNKLSDIDIFIADAPDYDNAGLLYKYITKLSDGSCTSLWHRYGSGIECSLVVQLARMLASNNRVARQKLTGVIKGSSLAFNSIIKHAYNSNREFEISECTWDLYEEKWTVTLLEVLGWSDEAITFTSESSQGESISLGSSGEILSAAIINGYTGPQGPQGYQGNLGYQGYQGEQGEQGVQGTQGYQGVPGAGLVWMGQWYNDYNYQVGDAVYNDGKSYVCTNAHINQEPPNASYWDQLSDTGAQGPQGYQGYQGSLGYQGVQGDQGYQGVQGTQGYQGVPGAGLVWMGQWYNDYNYQVGDAVYNDGKSYVCTNAHINHEPPNASYWDQMSDTGAQGPQGYQGTTGSQGATGAQGTQGNQGSTGAQGATGSQGPQGYQGTQGTINVTAGTGTPSGGNNGDVYFQYT